MKLGVAGLGLIGGSLSLELRARGFVTHVMGVDANPQNAVRALELGLVDQLASMEQMAGAVDLLVLAVPVDELARMLPKVLSLIGEGTTVTDMGSTKQPICDAVERHERRHQFVPSHPMAGTENSGPSAAFRGLFSGKTAVICDPERSGNDHLRRVEAMYEALAMPLIRMGAAEHDAHVALISHLPHAISFALANTALAEEKNATAFELAGGGFESTARLAKSSSAMWGPIFEQNRENVLDALARYIAHLQAFHRALAAGDSVETKSLMDNANRIRRVLERIESRKSASTAAR